MTRAIAQGLLPSLTAFGDTNVTATVRDNTDNSQVVGSTNDGTREWVFPLPSGTATNVIAGSLVASPITVSWGAGSDDSGDAVVVISNEAGNDPCQARTADATVLFTRVASGNANVDLFVWDGGAVTRLTGTGSGARCDHAVLGNYAGAR